MSQESDCFKRDFLLGLSCPSDSPSHVTLLDRRTGKELAQDHGSPLDRTDTARLIHEAREGDHPARPLRKLGGKLSATLMPPKIASVLEQVAVSGPVRLGLRLKDPEPADIPWECALTPFEPKVSLAIHPSLHVYRVVEAAPRSRKPRRISKILVAVADPQTQKYPALTHAEPELNSILKALTAPECRDIQAIPLKYANPASLARSLAENGPDVVHLICHGDVRASGGVVVLEGDRAHKETILYADDLAKLLNASGARVVILSGCFTAVGLASSAAALVGGGVLAVVGMQTAITDSGAMLFSRALYASLAQGAPLEVGVSTGRTAISGLGLDWVAPILMTAPGEPLSFEPATGAASSAPTAKHNIPLEERRFIGRQRERANLQNLILSGASRLVTVTGMGGMGKTSLAKRIALDLVEEFDHGVCFVECEALGDAGELLAAMAVALGLENASISESEVLSALSGKSMLLVFDCFEKITASAGLLPRILQAEAGIRILVTSRKLLGVSFEQEFRLDEMSVKKSRTQAAEGMELFEETAACVVPNFKINRTNRKLVTGLLVDLEGVPLAIVLAAGRLRHMSLEELQHRVRTQRLDTLKRAPRGRNDKHSDLLRVVGDSMALLLEEDRALMKALSVFQGGFFQDDARAVLGDSTDLMDGISLLRDHSFLISQVVNARMRFRILDTIREFLDRIQDDETVLATRERHSRHFAGRAQKIREAFDAGRYGTSRELLALDLGNYRSGAQWAVRRPDPDLVRQYAHALARVYFETGSQQEFEHLSAAAESVSGEEDASLLMELYGLQGESHRRNNRPDMALEVWERKTALCRKMGDAQACADTLLEIARIALRTGREAKAKEALAELSELRSEIKDLVLVATGIALRAQLFLDQNRLSESAGLCQELETMLSTLAVDRESLYAWSTLARVYRSTGRFEDGARAAYRCLARALNEGHLMAAGLTLLELSRIHEGLGDPVAAARQIAIAAVIPAQPWPSMAEQVVTRRQEFQTGPHGPLLAEAEASIGKADWQALARLEVPEPLRA